MLIFNLAVFGKNLGYCYRLDVVCVVIVMQKFCHFVKSKVLAPSCGALIIICNISMFCCASGSLAGFPSVHLWILLCGLNI